MEQPVVNAAPEGSESFWLDIDGRLYIWVSEDLDKVARQRYIEQAKREHGIESHRRNRLLSLLPAGHAAGHGNAAATTAVIGTGAVAVGIAAAVLMPAVLDDSSTPARKSPPAAAPAPTMPNPPADSQPPMSPPKPPGPTRPAATPDAPRARKPLSVVVHVAPVSTKARVRIPGVHTPLPRLPASPPTRILPPVTHQPTPPLAVSLSQAGAQVWVSPGLSVHAHLGSLRLRLGTAHLGIEPGRIS